MEIADKVVDGDTAAKRMDLREVGWGVAVDLGSGGLDIRSRVVGCRRQGQ